ncbi:MAG: DEAD/DEAH box helicase [Alphaproteobacteria bacterium]|nr:DEAD/DEAH box helicase [Alphaproteobacteria bacterium]
MTIQLRDYQEKAVKDVRQAYKEGFKAPFLTAPTGAGKTVMLAEICASASIKKTHTILLVHRQELVVQTAKTLAKFGIEHSIIAPAKVVQNAIRIQVEQFKRSFFRDESFIYIATVQTLVRRMADLPKFDLLLIDEAHHGVAGTWLKIVKSYPGARVLGVSATPERLDGQGLGIHCGGIFDVLIEGPTIGELIERGYLTRPRVYCPPIQADFDGLKTIAGDFDRKEQEKRLNKPRIIGDVIAHYRKYCDGVPAIAFCPTVEYAKYVADNFNAAGYRAASIDGKMDDYARNKAIDDLGNGRLDVLTSCEIVSEGTDIPVVGAAILLRKTKSLGLYLQQVGRALRPYPGKTETIILDHVGNCNEHGLPDEPHKWTLDGRVRRGRSGSGGSLACRQCLNCYAVYPSTVTVCPVCGTPASKTKIEIEEVEGELVEFQKRAEKIERGRAKTMDELIEFGKQKGMKNPAAWAWYVYNGRRAKEERRRF